MSKCTHGEEMSVDCSAIYKSGQTLSGIYTIYPTSDIPVRANCHMISCGNDTDNGGWTVIQRRMDGSVSFYRPWKEYKRGFGNVEGEYWLGLENLYQLTRKNKYMLRVDMEDFGGKKVFALYSSFSVDCEMDGYQLHVSGFTDGGAGDALSAHSEQKFTTFDKDQDIWGNNCAKHYLGGFWYYTCHNTNPNGLYLWADDTPHTSVGIVWSTWSSMKYYSMKSITMKIKQVI
ncbi:microfibril-associated glycoprotein 4-like [Garra rufa]|uniref:microfibril-associated glycoprotein 4-like n=1 Tax=Garra rufa TaxID=137080 RepID=UPI003CCE54CC